MAATDAAASLDPVSATMANNGATDDAGGVSPFEPSVWGDFFVNYTNPISKESQERMRVRAHKLQEEVRGMFEGKSTADLVVLVDTIEHLGIDHCFRDEIAAAMSRIRRVDLELSSSDDLHVIAARFRLLRQHGILESAEVFDKFRDGATGSFSASLCSNPRGLLSFYNAAHMMIPGEEALDDAIAFAKRHLEAMTDKLESPLAEQVSRAWDIPLPRTPRRVESMHYIAEYEQEEAHDATLLELARLDFELLRCLHLEELREFSRWWSELYSDVKLPYVRDRVAESYFWTCIIIPEEENARARLMFAKAFKFTSLMDDTYDVHATLEESRQFNQAIQRMDEGAVSIVPEYLRRLYLRTQQGFQELEHMLEPDERYRMPYFIRAYKQLSEYYLQEAIWANQGHEPSFEEHIRVATMSSGLPMLLRALLLGAGALATREVFEWMDGVPDMVLACGQIARLLNDMAAYRLGKNKKDVANAHECYVKEFGVTGAEALAVIAGMTETAWRTLNRGCTEVDAGILPAVQMAVVSLARTMETFYVGGRTDAYTFGSTLKGLVTALFLKPIAD